MTEPRAETVFRSTLPDIPISDHLPLHDYVLECLADRRDRACLIDSATGEKLTLGDVDCLSRRMAAGMRASLGVRPGGTVMPLLPNSIEFAVAFLACSRLGAATTMANPLHTPAETTKQAAASGATVEPASVGKLRGLSSRVSIISLPPATAPRGYGMTEAGVLSMCMAFAKEPSPAKSGACGTVVRNAELKIIDPETGLSLRRNQPGEICIRGKQIMKGYLNNPEATAKSIDAEGWLHTGDIGYVDDNDEIVIVDRLKELIKDKGFQVAPAELEAMLIAHPGIADAAIVPMKDDSCGKIPVAFVVTSDGPEITEDAIKQYVAKQCSRCSMADSEEDCADANGSWPIWADAG
ncbi:unnamed protein product [Urochloa decumbens]|uniref:4-coumarate--CoA ligase n=1 Tax=Urochloa decumbens TaxID=240449 RepID=A0ABC9CZL0_9POAL